MRWFKGFRLGLVRVEFWFSLGCPRGVTYLKSNVLESERRAVEDLHDVCVANLTTSTSMSTRAKQRQSELAS